MSPAMNNLQPSLTVQVISESPALAEQVRATLADDELLCADVRSFPTRSDAVSDVAHPPDLILVNTESADACWLAGRHTDSVILFFSRPEDLLVKSSVSSTGIIEIPCHSRRAGLTLSPSMAQTVRYYALRQLTQRLMRTLTSREVRQTAQPVIMLEASTPYDPRSGWYSHAYIIDRCQEEVVRATRYSLPIALVLIDLIGIEDIAAHHGTEFINELVTQLAGRIRPLSRHCDVAGHYGPSAFLTILTNTDMSGAKRFCDRVNQALAAPLLVEDIAVPLEWSTAVVARQRGQCATPTELLNNLERRIEHARRLGMRRCVVAEC